MGFNTDDNDSLDQGHEEKSTSAALKGYQAHQANKKRGSSQSTAQPQTEQPRTNTNNFKEEGKKMSDTKRAYFDPSSPFVNSSAAGSELTRILEIGRKYFDEEKTRLSAGGTVEWNLVPIPGSAVQYILDSVILVATHRRNGITVSVGTSLLLMGRTTLPKQQPTEDGRTFSFSAVPNDIYDARYRETVKNLVLKNLADVGEVSLIGSITVPNNFVYEDSQVRAVLDQVMNDTYYSLFGSIYGADSEFDITAVIKDDEEIHGRVLMKSGDDFNMFLQPRRRDISMQVSTSQRRQGQTVNSLEGSRTSNLATIDAYADYIYLGRKTASRRGRRGRSEAEMDIYGIGLNITGMESGNRQTTEMQLLALASISALVREDYLIESLRPEGEALQFRDPTAVAVEQDKDFEPVPENPTKEEWSEVNEAVVREDSLNVFLHVEESGILSRVQRLFLDACDPSSANHKTARRELFDAAMNLTDGAIASRFNEADEIGARENRIILLGHWVDNNGVVRDLRHLDRFFMMTHFGLKGDLTALALWDNACYNTNLSHPARLSKMEEIIASVAAQYTITGHATPIHLNPDFLFGLTEAAKDAQLAIPTEGLTQETSRHQTFDDRYSGNGGYAGDMFRDNRRSFYRGR